MIDLPAVFERRPWGLVVVRGPDATSFLQAIVSQDLDPVEVGATVESLLLQPQGKLDVAFRATRWAHDAEGDEWWLDTEPAYGERLAAGLTRFRIRVKVDIEDQTDDTAMASVVSDEPTVPRADRDSGLLAVVTAWGATSGLDVIGPAAAVADWVAGTGLRVGTDAEREVLRIEAGIPALGVDVDESTIPQEAFLEQDAVSFTKGCFIGQELVCRIDTRGHVNRFLRRLRLADAEVPPRGSEVVAGGKVVGVVTSAAAVPGESQVVALAMLRREVEPPAEVTVRVDADEQPATVLA